MHCWCSLFTRRYAWIMMQLLMIILNITREGRHLLTLSFGQMLSECYKQDLDWHELFRWRARGGEGECALAATSSAPSFWNFWIQPWYSSVFNMVATILPFCQTFPSIQASREWHQIKVFFYQKYTNFGSHSSRQCNVIIISFKPSADVWIYLFHKHSISSEKTAIEMQPREWSRKDGDIFQYFDSGSRNEINLCFVHLQSPTTWKAEESERSLKVWN